MQNFNRGNYNYLNNNYNIPNYEQNIINTQEFNPYEGYIRGNMFKELYNSYKIDKPFDIVPLNEQAEMLIYIDAYSFALIDLNLYLDIHPNDKNAISTYNMYLANLEEYMQTYQNKYGPIVNTSKTLNSFPWEWIKHPWPWEKGD